MPSLNIIGNINLTGGEYKRNPFVATGGQITTFVSGGLNYTSHTFTASGVFTLLNGETTAQVLVVGGGGGGTAGGSQNDRAFGGGAGGVNYTASFFFKKNPEAGGPSLWTALVGNSGSGGSNPSGVPGAAATSGSTSQLFANYSYEQASFPLGGYGGTQEQSAGQGASGAGNSPTGGLAIFGPQGFAGGNGTVSGGGGAAETGSVRNGGNGLAFTLQDGTSKFYGGGGGGGGYSNVGPTGGGTGGLGGGGNGGSGGSGAGADGTPNTGGGGGGGNTANDAADRGNGGSGGSGIIIISYPTGGV
jgi:hypothetical protein